MSSNRGIRKYLLTIVSSKRYEDKEDRMDQKNAYHVLFLIKEKEIHAITDSLDANSGSEH